jgi:hypothetical protein
MSGPLIEPGTEPGIERAIPLVGPNIFDARAFAEILAVRGQEAFRLLPAFETKTQRCFCESFRVQVEARCSVGKSHLRESVPNNLDL